MPLKRESVVAAHPERLPKRDWLIDGLLLNGHLNLLIGKGGLAKSSLAVHLAVLCASGDRWLTWRPTRRTRVLLLAAEENIEEQQKRVEGALAATGIKRHQVAGWLDQCTDEELALVARPVANATPSRQPLYHELRRLAGDPYGLIIVDPLISFHRGLDENSNSDMQTLAVALRSIARESRCCVLAAHHLRKGGEAADAESLRGASAVKDAARVVIGLDPLSPAERVSMLTPEQSADAKRYLKMTMAKGNYTDDNTTWWLRRQSVEIPNGESAPGWFHWEPESEQIRPVDVGDPVE